MVVIWVRDMGEREREKNVGVGWGRLGFKEGKMSGLVGRNVSPEMRNSCGIGRKEGSFVVIVQKKVFLAPVHLSPLLISPGIVCLL